MKTSHALLFSLVALALVGCSHQTERVSCLLTDTACVNQAANEQFQTLVEEMSDTMFTELLPTQMANVNLTSKNVTSYGLNNCSLVAKVNPESSTYSIDFVCKDIAFTEGYYLLTGRMGPYLVNGTGNSTKTYSNCTISISGPYKNVTKCGKEYMQLINFAMTTDVGYGNMEVSGLYVAEYDECTKDVGEWRSVTTEDGKVLEPIIRDTFIFGTIQNLIQNKINTVLGRIPISEYFSIPKV